MSGTSGPWIVGYPPGGVTGGSTSTCAEAGPVCGGRDWPVEIVTCGINTIAICPASSAGDTALPARGSEVEHARLIAAAPDMLEELRRCFDFASAVYESDRAAGKERSAEQARKRANCIAQLISKVEG